MSKGLETQLVRECAPTLAGIKTANLFNYKYSSREEFMQELAEADEVIVSSSGGLCTQAVELDGKPVGGKAPELLKKLQDAYAAYYAEDTKA